ncbi:pro-interleukin-16 [Galendromus occidentalis]|uniref:Pro-interleukin-16 n=1 Tax=Galendromus occidentalis TaxID=34638 RepID=A0AAJ7L2T5_9ACAR|nr:pro-interleukin-16 [Galendromus occidentalis]
MSVSSSDHGKFEDFCRSVIEVLTVSYSPVLLDKPDLEPMLQDDSSSSSSEDDLVGMERCSPSGDSFNSSSSSAGSVVDASSPVSSSPTLTDLRRTTSRGGDTVTEPLRDVVELANLPTLELERESAAPDLPDELQAEEFAVSSNVDSGIQEEISTLDESAELFPTSEPDQEGEETAQIDRTCSQQSRKGEQETSVAPKSSEFPASQSASGELEEETAKMMTLNYSSGRLPPDGREFPTNFDEPKVWKEVFRGHKSLSVDDSGVFCSTPSSDESHSPTQKSPSPAFSSENLLISNQYNSPINGDRRGSMSSVYSKFREASQRRYSGLLMSMLEPNSSEPKSKLKGLVLSKSDTPTSTVSKVLPVIVTNPVVVKVDSTPVRSQKAQTTDTPRAVPLGAAATFRKSLGFGDVSNWDTPSRPAPPLPGPAGEDAPDAPPKGDLIERYLSSYQDQESDEKPKQSLSGSCANIATIKDAELFARTSIGETRSKWQSMEFQTLPQGPPPVPPRPASRQLENPRTPFASVLKSAKSEASLNIIPPSNGTNDTEVVPGPQNFRALAAKWEQRSSRDTAPPIPARKSSDPRIVQPKPAARSSLPNTVPALPPNYPPPVRPAPRGTSDVKKTFEEVQRPIRTVDHKRFPSVDSDDSGNSSTSTTREQYSSLTSLASTTSSLISPQDLQQLIDEANQSLQEEEGVRGENIDIYVVVLHKDSPTSGAGITLAGGCDYENKEITVHKVITGSAADRDGRIRRGDRVLSINGKTLKATTHREALDILKSPRSELVLVLSRDTSGRGSSGTRSSLSRASSISSVLDVIDEPAYDGPLPTFEGSTVIVLEKDKVGLGFTLQGGKDSPLGNKPLTINRIFSCGAAERDGRLQPGDELLAINNTVTTSMTRTEAWNFLKKLTEGKISFTIRQQQSR